MFCIARFVRRTFFTGKTKGFVAYPRANNAALKTKRTIFHCLLAVSKAHLIFSTHLFAVKFRYVQHFFRTKETGYIFPYTYTRILQHLSKT